MNTATSSQASITARIADRLADCVGPQRYRMWFGRSARLDYHDAKHRLEVSVPNRFVADWISRHFQEDLRQAASREVGQSIDLAVSVSPELFEGDTQTPVAGDSSANANESGDSNTAFVSCDQTSGLTRPRRARGATRGEFRHRLEDFVVGPSNELAFSAASRVAQGEQTVMNPLFIHGGCGLGKTHLLQGICAATLQEKPQTRVLYTTGEQFTNEFLASMRANKLDAFRRRIRQLDLLAVDDVHFLANKQATQQEFLHSFDAVDLGGARVILASDNHPKLIKQFSSALVSRCVRGMVVQMHLPDAATRSQIIRVLSQRRGMVLSDQTVVELTARCVGSVREIEGALTKLYALAHLTSTRKPISALKQGPSEIGGHPASTGERVDQTIGHALLRQLFDHQIDIGPRKPIHIETILRVVAEELAVSRAQIFGQGRHRHVVLARSLAIYLARQLTPLSYPEIAAAMQRSTHSTIVTAAQRVSKQLKQNPTVILAGTMEEITLAALLDRIKSGVMQAQNA